MYLHRPGCSVVEQICSFLGGSCDDNTDEEVDAGRSENEENQGRSV